MTHTPLSPERDEAIRKLAGELSAVIQGHPIDIAIAAAALLIVVQCEPYKNPDLDRYAAQKLRQVADVLNPAVAPAAPTVDLCRICKRPLNQPNDPTSEDCGGDCLRCMASFDDELALRKMRDIEPNNPEWLGQH